LKRKTGKQKFSPKLKRLPGISLAVILIALAAYGLGWSDLLAVKSIVISAGNEESLITQTLIPGVIHNGEPLARIDVAAISRKLSSLSWVAKSTISRNWLSHKVSITVVIRKPVASFVAADSTTHYLDLHGVEFELPAPDTTVPTINFSQSSQSSQASQGAEQMAALLVQQIPAAIIAGMDSLTIDSQDNASMVASVGAHHNITIIWGDATSMGLKVNVLMHLLALPENAKITKIDLTNPLSPIVR